MKKNKASISQATTYQELSTFWSEHDLTNFWDQTKPAKFEVDICSEKRYYPLEKQLGEAIAEIALEKGVTVEILLNLWVQEKIIELGGKVGKANFFSNENGKEKRGSMEGKIGTIKVRP